MLVVQGWASVTRVLAVFAASQVVAAVFLVVALHCRRRCLGWRLHWPAMKHWLAIRCRWASVI